MSKHRIVVGFSGGVTSAWAAGWALENYSRDQVTLLFHDTKEEHPDTYRFIREMAAALDMPVTEQSDGRSVTEVFRDEGALANNRMAFCSRILKAEQRDKYFAKLRREGYDAITNVLGFSHMEEQRIQRATARAWQAGYDVSFPVAKGAHVTKQECADWCVSFGVQPPAMYRWSEHANCVGCVRGGKAYWLKVKESAPDVWAQRVALEAEFGHTFLKDTTLVQLAITGLKRPVRQRESIDIGPCECGG